MARTPVSSSNIAAIGYDTQSSRLEVEFVNGSIYQYFHVPKLVYKELLEAPSIGAYFASEIKSIYSFEKIG